MTFSRFHTAAWRMRSAHLIFLFLFAACTFFAADSRTAVQKPYKPQKPTSNMGSIATLLIRLAANQHYSGKRYDSELSTMIFDDYLKSLDPFHMFFLRSDVEKLAKDRKFLSAQLLKGDVTFAFEAFNLMVSRMAGYEKFAKELLSQEQNLSTDEEFDLEHDKAPYPADEKEMKDFWRRKILNDLIVLRLADRAEAEAEKSERKEGAQEEKKDETAEAGTEAPAEAVPVKKTPEERILQRISRTLRYFQEMEPMDVLEIYLTSAVQVLDPHSAYMSPRSNEDFDIDMSLSLVGIGAVLSSDDGYTKIVEIIPGGPADLSGELKAGDRIIAVRQDKEEKVDVIDMPLNKVVSMIRGKENTKVHLTVLKAGRGLSSPVQITITRAKIELKNSAAQGKIVLRNGKRFGVIRLPSFYMDFNAAKLGAKDFRSASGDVMKILLDFHPEELDGVVIDLRSNGGGSLREALKLTGLFIKEGPVVQVRGRHETEIECDDDDGLLVYQGPLAVLINQYSASSSEIFAAAIRDYERGVITGDVKTHGKGTVQFVNDLDRYMPYFTGKRFPAGSIRLTSSKFYRINGESTQLKGVEADVPFPSFTDFMDVGEDKLDHALPWDTIKPTGFERFKAPWAVTPEVREELRRRSLARTAQDPDFKLLNSWIEEFRKFKDRKSVPLNMEARWEEYRRQEDLRKEQEALYEPKRTARSRAAAGWADEEKEKKSETGEEKDIYLSETLNVLCDLIEIAHTRQEKKD